LPKIDIPTKGNFSFAGGIHPADSKSLTRQSEIKMFPAAGQLTLLLSQHIGAPCQPLVEKKQQVKLGEKIGDVEAFVSAPVHSPINGTVKQITLAPHIISGRSLAVTIDADADNNSPKQPCPKIFIADFSTESFTQQQICDAVREAGIVGMGGAGFPTSVKIAPNPKQPKQFLIINACECEPYITCDYRIMLEWTNQIVAGIKLAKKATGCSQVFIGIEDNKPDAIKAMTKAVNISPENENIKVISVKTKYPQGGERQLINSILATNVPTGAIPPMIGVVVLNVATCAAIAEAVVRKNPLTHRVVTVTGEGVKNPGNFYVPIGTAICELIKFCGGMTEDAEKVILGGPMMGIAIADLTTPTTKTTGAVTVLTKTQIAKQTACIRCGRCLQACPENLNPTKIAHAVKHNLLDIAENYYINGCIECGCCSYVCPANIPITGLIKTGKLLIAKQKKLIP